MSAPANLQPDDDIQGSVNWVGKEPRLACCVCDNYQQAINTRAAPRFLLQPMQYSPVCGHTGSQCFGEGDRGNWADRWFHGIRVGTRVGHTGPGYPHPYAVPDAVFTGGIQTVQYTVSGNSMNLKNCYFKIMQLLNLTAVISC